MDPMSVASKLVGFTVKEAQSIVVKYDYSLRIVKEDGIDFAMTAEYDPMRINIGIENDMVDEVFSVG